MDGLMVMLLATVLAYGAGPMVLAFVGKKVWTGKGLIAFCVIYTLIIFLGFGALAFAGGAATHSSNPAWLWGTVFYFIAQFKMRRDGRLVHKKYKKPNAPPSVLPHNTDSSVDSHSSPPVSPEPDATNTVERHTVATQVADLTQAAQSVLKTAEQDENCLDLLMRVQEEEEASHRKPEASASIESSDRRRAPIWVPVVLGVLCVVLVIGCCVLGSRINGLESENASLSEQIKEKSMEILSLNGRISGHNMQIAQLRDKNEALESEIQDAKYEKFFTHCCIGLIYEGDDTYFHATQCDNVPASTFFVLTSKACDSIGLSPCPYCHTEQELNTIRQLIGQ